MSRSTLRPLAILAVAVLSTAAAGQFTNRTGLSPRFKFSGPVGSLPSINVTQSMIIDTDITPMPIEALSYTVQPGVVLQITGSRPFYVKAALDIFIFGEIDASGVGGELGGGAGPGGFAGGTNGQAGMGPRPGRPATGNQGGGGGGGNGTAGQPGTGPDGGAGGGINDPGVFEPTLTPGSGGSASIAAPGDGIGGGGGGIIRLHAGGRMFISGVINADGGRGDDTSGIFQIARGPGGGSGGAIELITPLLQVSGGSVTATGGVGGDGILQDGGTGGDGVIVIRTSQPPSTSGFLPQPLIRSYGMTLTPECPEGCVAVQPDFADFPAAFGAQAYLLFSSSLLPAGQEVPLGGGKALLINPNDPLFDPLASPIYQLLLGQGSPIAATLEAVLTVQFAPIVAALLGVGIGEFSIFMQAVLIQNGLVFDASEVIPLSFISTC